MATTNKLTEKQVKTALPRDKAYKLIDGGGLFLLVQPAGGKWWRLRYWYEGKENSLSLGVHPEITLKDARVRRDEARKQLAHDTVLLTGLRKLRDEQHLVAGQPSFAVSASSLMGSSKLLSALDGKSLRLFGIDLDKFTARIPYVMVGGGGEAPQTVILVENPIAFEAAIQSAASVRHAFVCTFGFGLSNSASEHGNQLAGAIETGGAILLRRTEGLHTSFNKLIQHPEIHFWGDLDIAGLQIFERIASRIPHLKLSALYEPMIKAAANLACRHPYVAAVGKAGQKTFRPTRKDTEAVLGYCEKWAVDQEIVSDYDIQMLSGAVLEFK